MATIELPDFDDLEKTSNIISELSLKKGLLELNIKNLEKDIVLTAVTDSKYYVGGKIPSQVFIDATYKQTGFNGELIPLRDELVEVTSELGRAKNLFDLLKLRVDVWRSEQANERAISL